uniref:Letm1 RBD domain-containing protein n=1 Tax=Parastrongyloides trichosuri TaxID=131310 RepID=A0A0N4Z246_PARTI
MIFAPRQVLTRHFWNSSRRKEFLSLNLSSKSQFHFGPLLSKINFKDGLSPPLNLKDIKQENVTVPALESMEASQMYHLLRLYQISPINGITKLRERSLLLHCLDNQLRNEDYESINVMEENDVITQLYIRRIIFKNDEDVDILRNRLKEWVKYSEGIYEKGNESLILYAPVVAQGIGLEK